MGAMENKGLNIFNDALILASPETATDADFAAIERVVAHEYFHNWTGNRITCRDWFQLCLKEGLTVFRDQEFCADQRSRHGQRIRDVRNLKARAVPRGRAGRWRIRCGPDRYIEINNFYTATVYEKGAEVVRMMQTLLGREGFRKGMDLYFERHDGQAATVEDFVACFEDATGKDLAQFMTWYSQAGTPELVCQLKYDARDQDRRPRRSRRCCRRRRARPRRSRCTSRCGWGCSAATARTSTSTLASGERARGRRRRGHASAPRPSASATCPRGRCRRCCAASRRPST